MDDVHHVLHGQRLEVELVAGGVVGRDGLGVVVDDDGLVARRTDRPDGVHGRVVEFDALADADRAGTEHDDLLFPADDRLVFFLVGRVEIGHVGGEFAGAGVDHLVDREDVVLLAQTVHFVLRKAPQLTDVLVAETHALGSAERLDVHRVCADDVFELDDVLELLQEEHVDLRLVVDQRQVDAVTDQLADGIEPVVGSPLDVGEQVVVRPLVEFLVIDVADARFERTHGLEQRLLHRAADGHHLARGLHLRAELVRRVGELVEGKAGDLRHDVVQRRFERSRRIGDPDLVERESHGDLRADAGDGIARGLRRQGRGARHAGIDLDQVVFERERVECELHVAAALDLQFADDLQRRVAQHLELLVGERLARGNDDRVAGVDAHRVDILHAADADGRVVAVAHHLVLDLLIALDALLDEHLVHGRERKGVAHHLAQFGLVVGETAARAAQREGRAQHHRIADLLGHRHGLLDRHGDVRRKHRLAQRLAQLLEQLAVLGALDRLERRAQNFDLALFQNALLGQLHGEIQTRLSAQPRDDGVGTLEADDLGDVFQRQRLHVDFVRNVRVGHNGSGVRVGEDHLVTLLLEREARLRTRIVELGGLSDDDGPRTDDQNLLDIFSPRHFCAPPLFL